MCQLSPDLANETEIKEPLKIPVVLKQNENFAF